MKKILFLSFAALCFAVTTHAQSADTSAHHGGRMDRTMMMQKNEERMAKELSLTDDQKAKFKTLDEAQQTKLEAIRKSGGDNNRQAFMDAMKETNDKKRAILTADQQTKWDAMMKERQTRMQNMRRGGGNNGGGQQ
ncbi:MAG TPA: hypothetical protein VGB84_03690 [Arachidicoccus sp.]